MERVRPQAESLREQALGIIRDAITAGELAEDRIYSAAGLAKQLGMSLSPVREAMMALVTEGTVEAVPNRGFRLVTITEADLEEIIAIRVLLAVPAARSLAEADSADIVGRDQRAGADPRERINDQGRRGRSAARPRRGDRGGGRGRRIRRVLHSGPQVS
jgi:DNA-binding GntR family transcriptional regulator